MANVIRKIRNIVGLVIVWLVGAIVIALIGAIFPWVALVAAEVAWTAGLICAILFERRRKRRRT